jgi:hypothetical protein
MLAFLDEAQDSIRHRRRTVLAPPPISAPIATIHE